MKKLLIFLLFAGLMSSCYDPYRLDYEYSSVAFAYGLSTSGEPSVLYRTVVKDEGLRLDVGIYLAGILENTEDRWADFVIDPTLLDGTAYQLMPENYYSLSNDSRFDIPSGSYVGRVTVTLDSALFINDTLSLDPVYAIPFRLMETSEDSILSTQATQILVVRYINHYTGFYDQAGSFETVDPEGTVLNQGAIENVIEATTIMLDTVDMNGMMNLTGANFHMKLAVDASNNVTFSYLPNLSDVAVPENIAPLAIGENITTSYVSGWETLEYINDGYNPANSGDKGDGAYGNWPNPMTWNWLQYTFPKNFIISQSDVYWWTDGGGIQIPFNTYVEVYDIKNDQWVIPGNPVVNGVATDPMEYGETDTLVYNDLNPYIGVNADQYNTTSFDPVLTNGIRIHFIARESQGVLEWKVWGLSPNDSYEQKDILSVVSNGTSSFDPETSTLNLNYRVNYVFEDYHTDVTTVLTWRNRVRDGVNEWRR
ncbi:MAG: DUF1735 domain-containing protein [Bacteroidota bacterium]